MGWSCDPIHLYKFSLPFSPKLSYELRFKITSGGGGGGGSGCAMVLGKLPVPGRPAYFDYSKAQAYCAYSRCGWGC